MTGRARRALTFLVPFAALVLGVATPAGAHSTSGPPASNFHGVVDGVRPQVAGVTARLAPDGERVELHVQGPARVTILGYQGEPYLRISRNGVFENRSSPAVALNQTRVPTGAAPSGRIRAPHWVRISAGPTGRWHDHRAHWMGGATPPAVRQDPDRPHVIERWRIPIRIGGARVAVTGTVADTGAVVGTIEWNPPPDALVWFGVATVLAVAVLAGARVGARPTLLVALAALAVAESVHLWGAWPFSTADAGGRVGENLPSIAAIASSVLAFVWLARRTPYSAAPLLVIAGLFTAVAGGFADLPALSHAWVPSRLDPMLARTLVAVALGVGTGVALAGGARLRPRRPVT